MYNNNVSDLLQQINPTLKQDIDQLTVFYSKEELITSLSKDVNVWVRENIGVSFPSLSYYIFGETSSLSDLRQIINFFKPYRSRLIELINAFIIDDRIFESLVVDDSTLIDIGEVSNEQLYFTDDFEVTLEYDLIDKLIFYQFPDVQSSDLSGSLIIPSTPFTPPNKEYQVYFGNLYIFDIPNNVYDENHAHENVMIEIENIIRVDGILRLTYYDYNNTQASDLSRSQSLNNDINNPGQYTSYQSGILILDNTSSKFDEQFGSENVVIKVE